MSLVGTDPVFTVSEFVAVFNQTLQVSYPRIYVTGEVSNFRIARNAWVHFDLKDEFSQLRFFGSARNMPGPIENGMYVQVCGRPQLHNQYGFSISFENITLKGQGSIKKAKDLLAKKLAAEGLFEPDRKRPLPYAPSRVGLITAENSAALSDFIKISAARWPAAEISLIDAVMQGPEAPDRIIAALKAFNEAAETPELLALVRGGGSPEDLACFSDERVVRAVVASRIPIVVAVGHEQDLSLAELAADRRASTPSNAAEVIFPDKNHEKVLLGEKSKIIAKMTLQHFKNQKQSLSDASTRINTSLAKLFETRRGQLNEVSRLVSVLDPKLPLKRGFSLVVKSGRTIRKASEVNLGDRLEIVLHEGKIISEVKGKTD